MIVGGSESVILGTSSVFGACGFFLNDSMRIGAVRVGEKLVSLRVSLNIFPSSARPSAGDKFHVTGV